MKNYREYWKPQTYGDAQYFIDTGNAGDDFWRWGRERYAEMTPYLPEPCSVVVDYGCGIARVLKCHTAERRIGLDVSPEMLDFARAENPDLEFMQIAGNEIPLPDGTVDFLYSLLVLQHMDAADVQRVLTETARTLKASGRCFMEFSAFGDAWSPDARQNDKHAVLMYTPEIICEISEAAGLEVLQIFVHPVNYLVMVGRRKHE
jgi:ubiquinone/menaquinone biosynthesis C-methylase UbiE